MVTVMARGTGSAGVFDSSGNRGDDRSTGTLALPALGALSNKKIHMIKTVTIIIGGLTREFTTYEEVLKNRDWNEVVADMFDTIEKADEMTL